jgi:hypothetical protein
MKERVFLTVGSSTGIRPSRRERFALESRSPVTNNMKLVDKQTEIFLRRSAIMGKRTNLPPATTLSHCTPQERPNAALPHIGRRNYTIATVRRCSE